MGSGPVLTALLVVGALLSGCSGSSDDPGVIDPNARPSIAEGKGAISGLLIDDIYRPIPGGLILIEGLGLTATTDARGQFTFVDLEPRSYIALASAAGHEAAPINIDVVAGEYAEVEIPARRLFSEGGRIVTTQFSTFIPCAADFVVNGLVANCLGDSSGDSYRPGFTTKNVTGLGEITYMVSEVKVSKPGDWVFQVREDDGSPGGGDRYAVAILEDTDYHRIIIQYDVVNEADNGQGNNKPWTGDKPFATILFMHGQLANETGGAGFCCGAGAEFGIKAQFMQSIFIGEPEMPIESYCVLATTCS